MHFGSWASARAQGAISPADLVAALPSAFSADSVSNVSSGTAGQKTPARGVRTENTVEPALSSTGAQHPQTDVWSDDVLGTVNHHAASIEVLFPRTGDSRGLHDCELIEQAGHAGAAIRIGTGYRDTAASDAAMIVIPLASHENLHTWALRSDQSAVSGPHHVPFGGNASVSEADRLLKQAILEAESTIDDLGLRAGRRESRDLLDHATNELAQTPFPHSLDANRRSLLQRAAPIMWLCDLALADDSVTISRTDQRARFEALLHLDRVARHAIEAATTWSRRG